MTSDPVIQRFQTATAALEQLLRWLETPSPAPDCVADRCDALGVSIPRYRSLWKERLFPDPWREIEQTAIVDAAIRRVQPDWKRGKG